MNGLHDKLEQIELSLSQVQQAVDTKLDGTNQAIGHLSLSIDRFRETMVQFIQLQERSVPIKLVYYILGIVAFAFGGGAALAALKTYLHLS
jgi:hypothetical protein